MSMTGKDRLTFKGKTKTSRERSSKEQKQCREGKEFGKIATVA